MSWFIFYLMHNARLSDGDLGGLDLLWWMRRGAEGE